MSLVRIPIEKSDVRWRVGDVQEIAATVYRPAAAPRALVWCLPGGGVDRRYWDVPVQGADDRSFSFALRAAAAGYMVVTADHLGTGESAAEEPDHDQVADTMSAALARARHDLDVPTLRSVGVGHSMGSGFTLHQQDRHRDHAALVITGWSNIALMLPHRDGEFRPVGAPGQPDMRRHNHGPGVSNRLKAANRAIRTNTPGPALEWVISPGRLAEAAARVDVPVLLVHGHEDVTPDAGRDAELYARAPSVKTVVLSRSHHWHSGSPDRHLMWDAIVEWLDATVPPGAEN